MSQFLTLIKYEIIPHVDDDTLLALYNTSSDLRTFIKEYDEWRIASIRLRKISSGKVCHDYIFSHFDEVMSFLERVVYISTLEPFRSMNRNMTELECVTSMYYHKMLQQYPHKGLLTYISNNLEEICQYYIIKKGNLRHSETIEYILYIKEIYEGVIRFSKNSGISSRERLLSLTTLLST
jgi:hypothetical protein